MFRIGIVGLMASGKSSVARRLQERGALLVEADVLGWEVLGLAEVKEALAKSFGDSVFGADGAVDRRSLARRVFKDVEAMARLNAIVQPSLRARVREALAAPKGEGVLVLDAALLTVWRLEPELDLIVEVVAPVEVRIERLFASKGFSEAEARERIEGQALPPVRDPRRYRRIQNDGSMAELLSQADRVWEEVVRLRPGDRTG